ncbi:MAG: diaminopimelate epimerase [Verrucomicrobiales bacterium]|nr:diaminopimelate epimerase [Verrucomicrobiales bacterium]
MTLHFTKMNGAGNDFVMLDNRDGRIVLSREQIARLCDRHRGIGADGLLAVEPAQAGGDFRMRYYNADGGEAEMCGNGARCFGAYVRRLLGGEVERIQFETQAGMIAAEFIGDRVRINMSEPVDFREARTLHVGADELSVTSMNTGVPHAVVFVEDADAVDVRAWGSGLRYHEDFAPKGTNANFAEVLNCQSIRIRTYERGVEDETLACGTGMVASALIHHERTGAPSPISVKVQGGDVCEVGFEEIEPHHYRAVTLLGPADFAFEGTVEI